MLEKVLELEREAFLWLNSFHSPFADHFLWIYSGIPGWIPIILFLGGCYIFKNKWQEWTLLCIAILCLIMFCDLFTSYIAKPFFARFRPTHHPAFEGYVKTLHNYKGSLYGFISGHATNAFGFVLFSSLFFKYRPYTIFITSWALIMIYSRIYLGVHFISDIAGGILVGSLTGFMVYRLYLWLHQQVFSGRKHPVKPFSYSVRQKKIITWNMAGYIVILALFSGLFIPLFTD